MTAKLLNNIMKFHQVIIMRLSLEKGVETAKILKVMLNFFHTISADEDV